MPYNSFKQSTDYGTWLVKPQANFNCRAFLEVLAAANFSLWISTSLGLHRILFYSDLANSFPPIPLPFPLCPWHIFPLSSFLPYIDKLLKYCISLHFPFFFLYLLYISGVLNCNSISINTTKWSPPKNSGYHLSPHSWPPSLCLCTPQSPSLLVTTYLSILCIYEFVFDLVFLFFFSFRFHMWVKLTYLSFSSDLFHLA